MGPGHRLARLATRAVRRYLVGPNQRWAFDPPPPTWTPAHLERTTLYLHVPFCRNLCPYCPYTKVPYQESLLEPYTRAALAEVDWWADQVGPAEITSVYIGGGTPTLALASVEQVLDRVRARFHLTGDICIETNPADVTDETVRLLRGAGITLVSLGVQSFQPKNLALIGRCYEPAVAERALALLTRSGFASVNVDLMFALPGQSVEDVTGDLSRAEKLGANQVTTYPLFTFPYTAVGQYLRLKTVRMPDLRLRRRHYEAIHQWCASHNYERVSVWGFKRGAVPRYSSVTRDRYIGIGPGAGSHLPDGFTLNSFDLHGWMQAAGSGKTTTALRMPFTPQMAAWWWLYWRFYETRIRRSDVELVMGPDAAKALGWLGVLVRAGLAVEQDGVFELTGSGAFWLHLAQNYFALAYVNTVWTQARRQPWPEQIRI
jgi:oxygen-independent coproporphyrinogen III oxidase